MYGSGTRTILFAQTFEDDMFMKILTPLFLLIFSVAMSQSVYAADAAAGRKLAEQWCAKCHNIEKGAPFKLHPPSFASISVYRPAGDIFGKIFAPQHDMPDIKWVLQAEEMEDLTAYITSLEAK
jgi:mono/diheme cytochrome c family protein